MWLIQQFLLIIFVFVYIIYVQAFTNISIIKYDCLDCKHKRSWETDIQYRKRKKRNQEFVLISHLLPEQSKEREELLPGHKTATYLPTTTYLSTTTRSPTTSHLPITERNQKRFFIPNDLPQQSEEREELLPGYKTTTYLPITTYLSTTRPPTTSLSTTRPPTTTSLSTTRPPTTTLPSTTTRISTTYLPTTTHLSTTRSPTTTRLSTTRPPTTTFPSTTTRISTTYPPTTTHLSTTRPPTTTRLSTTRPPTTTLPSTTTRISTTYPPTTTDLSTTRPSITTRLSTTRPPTTTLPSTTSPFIIDFPSAIKICIAPPQPENGYWKLHRLQCSNGRDCFVITGTKLGIGSHLIYSCNKGYKKVNGSTDVICNFEGKWLNIPICEKITCKPLVSSSIKAECMYNDEWISCKHPLPYKTKASLSCQNSYRPETNVLSRQRRRVTCNASGKWEPDPMRCIAGPLTINVYINDTKFTLHSTFDRNDATLIEILEDKIVIHTNIKNLNDPDTDIDTQQQNSTSIDEPWAWT